MLEKIKKITKTVLITIILIFSFTVIVVNADSGWDGGYDSGGSDWSDSGGSNWGTDYSSDYSDGDSSAFTLVITIAFWTIVLIKILQDSKKKNTSLKHQHSVKPSVNIDRITQFVPDYDPNVYSKIFFDIYKNIQIAWMNFDYETLRKYTTDELFNTYKSQLEVLELQHGKNVMENFQFIDFDVTSISKNNDLINMEICLVVTCFDYIIDTNTNKVKRGNASRITQYQYEMTFIGSTKENSNHCPNCGAKLENNASSVCEYCDSIIINSNHGWVLARKKVITQINM